MSISLRNWEAEGLKQVENIFLNISVIAANLPIRNHMSNFLLSWPSTCVPKPSKNQRKMRPISTARDAKTRMQICLACRSLLGRFWMHIWGQLGTQVGYKVAPTSEKNLKAVSKKWRNKMGAKLGRKLNPSWLQNLDRRGLEKVLPTENQRRTPGNPEPWGGARLLSQYPSDPAPQVTHQPSETTWAFSDSTSHHKGMVAEKKNIQKHKENM